MNIVSANMASSLSLLGDILARSPDGPESYGNDKCKKDSSSDALSGSFCHNVLKSW